MQEDTVMTVFHKHGYMYQWCFGEYVDVYESYESFDRGDAPIECLNVWDHAAWKAFTADQVLDAINMDAEERHLYAEAF